MATSGTDSAPSFVPSVDAGDDLLTEAEALAKVDAACAGCQGEEGCCMVSGLRAAGWSLSRTEDEHGFTLRFDKPARAGGA